ncbi:DUF6993 domain-containing protein [Leifsonia aquatica]|uniref:DUF6993 domain-containing protein n=1 Tax=Leifsonia aquatica TaxID=144185 RepID=UPI00069359DC|nr:hypothetical protein [Leifsonia aquatica]
MTRRPVLRSRPTQRLRSLRAAAAGAPVIVAAVLALALAGCTPGAKPSATPSATPTPTSVASGEPAPHLIAGGSAEQNLPFFDHVNRATLAANPDAKGRDFIDALVAAGFAKADMQVTADTTTIGLKANSIQFSVKLGETCLIGQNGADAGGYNSEVTPVLSTGACLVGQTRAIDW